MNKKAIIAMSGGVDSTVAAHLMKETGYDIIGVTLRLYTNEDIADDSRTCCSLNDVEDAKAAAARMNIEHYTFNFTDEFKKEVTDRFIREYERGRTPNPCIDCNRYIKFRKLLERARQIGYDYVVTGHYASVVKYNGRYCIKRGADVTKDQSYVLYSLTQGQLEHIILPLGALTKAETRKIAEDNGFINARKRDSQDICFVPDGNYAGFIERATGHVYPEGRFVDFDGNVLGTHKGVIRYTRGQRKGLGLALPKPMYVCGTNLDTNEVILGDNADLFSHSLDADNVNLMMYDRLTSPVKVTAKIRYSQTASPATVWQTDDDTIHVEFDEPQRAITPGQAVVLYLDDYVVGGGVIRAWQN